MNTPSTLEMNMQVRSNIKTQRWVNALRIFPTLFEGSKAMKNPRSSNVPLAKLQNHRLGEVVQHGGFGSGRVMALWPDGRVLVRFDCSVKNQLIFPSLLS